MKILLFILALCVSPTVFAQGTAADYERASGLKGKYAVDAKEPIVVSTDGLGRELLQRAIHRLVT